MCLHKRYLSCFQVTCKSRASGVILVRLSRVVVAGRHLVKRRRSLCSWKITFLPLCYLSAKDSICSVWGLLQCTFSFHLQLFPLGVATVHRFALYVFSLAFVFSCSSNWASFLCTWPSLLWASLTVGRPPRLYCPSNLPTSNAVRPHHCPSIFSSATFSPASCLFVRVAAFGPNNMYLVARPSCKPSLRKMPFYQRSLLTLPSTHSTLSVLFTSLQPSLLCHLYSSLMFSFPNALSIFSDTSAQPLEPFSYSTECAQTVVCHCLININMGKMSCWLQHGGAQPSIYCMTLDVQITSIVCSNVPSYCTFNDSDAKICS